MDKGELQRHKHFNGGASLPKKVKKTSKMYIHGQGSSIQNVRQNAKRIGGMWILAHGCPKFPASSYHKGQSSRKKKLKASNRIEHISVPGFVGS
eukprot:5902938-Amphidinium_carterae.1